MEDGLQAIESALRETDLLQRNLAKKQSAQVQSSEERLMVKATALTWFKNHRSKIARASGDAPLAKADEIFQRLLRGSERSAVRLKLRRECKEIRRHLIDLRAFLITATDDSAPAVRAGDIPPDFAPLVQDVAMREILRRRWGECLICINNGAPLSATVMMGGLVEALLLARVNRETNKAPIFTAKTAPKDKAGKTLPLTEWTLKAFLDVAHQLTWVSNSAKDVGAVLRDYRNYIHPNKELTHGVRLTQDDARMLWDVCKNISREVIGSV